MSKTDFLNWKIGDIDNHGNTITYIHTAVNDYIIYNSGNDTLHYDENSTKVDYTKKLGALSKEMSLIEILSKAKEKKCISNQVALAWRECFNDNPEIAKGILENLIKKLISHGRILYVTGAACSFISILTIGLLVIYFLRFHPFKEELALVTKVFILGALGGLISILIKIKNLLLDPQSEKLNRIAGISRTIIAGTSSLVFYLAYKADIIFSFAKSDASNEVYIILLFSFFMGFSERFIPDFSNKISGLIEGDKFGT